jgi:hypothetical protein
MIPGVLIGCVRPGTVVLPGDSPHTDVSVCIFRPCIYYTGDLTVPIQEGSVSARRFQYPCLAVVVHKGYGVNIMDTDFHA